MAIYHLNVSSVGRKTQAAGTAGAHARYIMREEACSEILANQIPHGGNEARRWLNHEENHNTRVNGRVISKVRVALPLELTHAQNVAAIRELMDELTDGNRVPWAAAFHDKEGNDVSNPHVHIVIRDRAISSDEKYREGQRVVMFSANKEQCRKAGRGDNPVEFARKLWEEIGNKHLERAGHQSVLDRRTLQAQNVDRKPTIHEGQAAQAKEKKSEPLTSQDREVSTAFNSGGNLPEAYQTGDQATRRLNYASEIDQGRTRAAYNNEIRAENERRRLRAIELARQLAQQRRDAQQARLDAEIERHQARLSAQSAQHEAEARRAQDQRAQELRDRLGVDPTPALDFEEVSVPGAPPEPLTQRFFDAAAPPDPEAQPPDPAAPQAPAQGRQRQEAEPEPAWRRDLAKAARSARERAARDRDRDRDDDREPPSRPVLTNAAANEARRSPLRPFKRLARYQNPLAL